MMDTINSVGAIIKNGGKYLLLDRANYPFGFACIAGHIKEGQAAEEALKEEVKEESNLDVISFKKIHEEFVEWNGCGRHSSHDWRIFECVASGDLKHNDEAKSIGWFTKEEIKYLRLEKVWRYFFEKLRILG